MCYTRKASKLAAEITDFGVIGEDEEEEEEEEEEGEDWNEAGGYRGAGRLGGEAADERNVGGTAEEEEAAAAAWEEADKRMHVELGLDKLVFGATTRGRYVTNQVTLKNVSEDKESGRANSILVLIHPKSNHVRVAVADPNRGPAPSPPPASPTFFLEDRPQSAPPRLPTSRLPTTNSPRRSERDEEWEVEECDEAEEAEEEADDLEAQFVRMGKAGEDRGGGGGGGGGGRRRREGGGAFNLRPHTDGMLLSQGHAGGLGLAEVAEGDAEADAAAVRPHTDGVLLSGGQDGVVLSSGWVAGVVLAEEGGSGEEGGNKVREWLRSSGGGRVSRPASGMRPGSSKSSLRSGLHSATSRHSSGSRAGPGRGTGVVWADSLGQAQVSLGQAQEPGADESGVERGIGEVSEVLNLEGGGGAGGAEAEEVPSAGGLGDEWLPERGANGGGGEQALADRPRERGGEVEDVQHNSDTKLHVPPPPSSLPADVQHNRDTELRLTELGYSEGLVQVLIVVLFSFYNRSLFLWYNYEGIVQRLLDDPSILIRSLFLLQ